MPLTKHRSGITILTEDVANSWYGGLYGSEDGDALDSKDPLVAGHVHDGQHIDGHAQKIHLFDHVTGQLDGSNIIDGSIPCSKLEEACGGEGGSSAGTIIVKEGEVLVAGGPHDTLSFIGALVTVSDGGGGEAIIEVLSEQPLSIKEEGVTVNSATSTINFIGSGVTAATGGGSLATVTIPGPVNLIVRAEAIGVTTSAILAPSKVINNVNSGSFSQMVYFKGKVVAHAWAAVPPAADDAACWTIEGCVIRDQSTDTVSLPSAPVITPIYNPNPTDWDITVVVDNVSKELDINSTVNGFGAGPGTAPSASFYIEIEFVSAGIPL